VANTAQVQIYGEVTCSSRPRTGCDGTRIAPVDPLGVPGGGRKESGKHFLWHGYGEDRSRKFHNGIVSVQK